MQHEFEFDKETWGENVCKLCGVRESSKFSVLNCEELQKVNKVCFDIIGEEIDKEIIEKIREY